MKYKLQNIIITTGHNSRGEFSWFQADLFNDADPFGNPARLPRFYNMTEKVIEMYKPYCEPVPGTTDQVKVNEESLAAAIKEGKIPDMSHVDHVFAYNYPLQETWGRIYRSDETNAAGQVLHKAGEFMVGQNGEVTPVTSLVMYLKKTFDADSGEWTWVDQPDVVARRILERNYKRLEVKAVNTATMPAQAEAVPAVSEEDKEAERERLKAQLAALGV